MGEIQKTPKKTLWDGVEMAGKPRFRETHKKQPTVGLQRSFFLGGGMCDMVKQVSLEFSANLLPSTIVSKWYSMGL